MLKLFTPESKVQKDRNLIRETDYRMAKYNRRGVLLTITVFVITLLLGDFFRTSINLAIGLAGGLFLITLARGYVMFGFDFIYPRGALRWRTLFFVVSLLGSAWWGIIVATITRVLGFSGETYFLWLYSIVFYAGMCAILAPYLRFLTLYLLLGITPIGLASFSLNSAEGYIYGLVLVLLFVMLRLQSKMMNELYWERLEANFQLKQRADTLELEKRDSQAAAQLNHEFLVSLTDEFRGTLNDIVGSLSVLAHDGSINDKQRQLLSIAEKAGERQLQIVSSVIDYSKIKSRKLVIDETVFNLPKLIEDCFNEKEVDAEIHAKEFALNFSDNIPTRVRGDSIRTSQLINALIDQSIGFGHGAELDVAIACEQHGSTELTLNIDITDAGELPAETQQGMTTAQQIAKVSNFTLNMSKHLAVAMGGDVGIAETEKLTFWLELPLTTVSSQPFHRQYENKFHGEFVLIVDVPRKIEQELAEVFQLWGLKTAFLSGKQDFKDFFDQQAELNREFSLALVFSKKDSLTSIPISQKLAEYPAMAEASHVLVVSYLQAESRILALYMNDKEHIQAIQKPVTQDKLYQAFSAAVFERDDDERSHKPRILLIEDNAVDQMVFTNMLDKYDYTLDVTASAESGLKRLEQRDYDLVFLSCHLNGCEDCQDGFNLAQQIRDFNETQEKRVPLLGLTMLKNDVQDRMCFTSGMDDTMAKPIRKDELKKQLDHWLVTKS
ncbi:hybrid sensor histidine kinase/response regulator [Halioxenophilus aromaticivorans]|uniref:histidine kinase n=1 Tax=Halioxenophilus aromaticivorans TaxID=1306992 RepID=A0AAV3TXS6_9ALTE